MWAAGPFTGFSAVGQLAVLVAMLESSHNTLTELLFVITKHAQLVMCAPLQSWQCVLPVPLMMKRIVIVVIATSCAASAAT